MTALDLEAARALEADRDAFAKWHETPDGGWSSIFDIWRAGLAHGRAEAGGHDAAWWKAHAEKLAGRLSMATLKARNAPDHIPSGGASKGLRRKLRIAQRLAAVTRRLMETEAALTTAHAALERIAAGFCPTTMACTNGPARTCIEFGYADDRLCERCIAAAALSSAGEGEG